MNIEVRDPVKAGAAGTRRINWHYAPWLLAFHVIAALAFIPWFFSWTGVFLCIACCYVFGTLGITVCYHRLLTHRSFSCPKWLKHTLIVLGTCCAQDSP